VPTTTATKCLLFPFLLLTISLLAHQISELLNFFGALLTARRRQWQKQYGHELERRLAQAGEVPATLTEQFDFLNSMYTRQEATHNFTMLSISLVLFVVFWAGGAAAFSCTEDWSMGNSLYFCVRQVLFRHSFADTACSTCSVSAVYFSCGP
jgi:potassium channel subfamily K